MMDTALKLQPAIALLFALGFIIIYSTYGKWWKTAIGRHMMGFMAGCSVLLTLVILVRFFPGLRENQELRFWSWNIVIGIFAWRFWVAVTVWILKNQSDLKKIKDE